MITLKQAILKNKLAQFIKERVNQTADETQFNSTLNAMSSGKSQEAHSASSQDNADD